MTKSTKEIKAPRIPLRVIPFYTGDKTLEDVLKNPASLRLLWIEILLNGAFPWLTYCHLAEVKTAYDKACVWYGHFKTMIDGLTDRPPLEIKKGKIDERESRKLFEALNFVTA